MFSACSSSLPLTHSRCHSNNQSLNQAAAGNAYNVADMASLPQAVGNADANIAVIFGAWRSIAPVL